MAAALTPRPPGVGSAHPARRWRRRRPRIGL